MAEARNTKAMAAWAVMLMTSPGSIPAAAAGACKEARQAWGPNRQLLRVVPSRR